MIAAATGHEIITDARLRERHLGIFQGLNGDEIMAKYPEEHRLYRTDRSESMLSLAAKACSSRWRGTSIISTRLAAKHQGETIVVVTHGGVVSGFFRHTLEIPLEAPRRFEFVNAGFNVFAYEEGNWMLLTWGDVSHLAPGAASEGDDP